MINQQDELNHLISLIRESPWVGLDTEADSLHAYPEKLCLIQVGIPNSEFLLDTLAPLDFQSFFKVLEDKKLIFHAADYDLRLLFKTFEFVPNHIFDTMLAARLLGYESFGLAALVEKFLDIVLEKGARKADWAKRPLTPAMEKYALNDIRYLHPIATRLEKELREKGRMEWHEEYCKKEIASATIPIVLDQERIWRLKGSSGLSSRSLAILRNLFYWREKQALQRNRPPYFVMSHENLIFLAQKYEVRPPEDLKKERQIPARYFNQIHAAIAQAQALPVQELPKRKLPSPSKIQKHPLYQENFDSLKEKRDRLAEELKIDPSLIVNKWMLCQLASNFEENQKDLMKWQLSLMRF